MTPVSPLVTGSTLHLLALYFFSAQVWVPCRCLGIQRRLRAGRERHSVTQSEVLSAIYKSKSVQNCGWLPCLESKVSPRRWKVEWRCPIQQTEHLQRRASQGGEDTLKTRSREECRRWYKRNNNSRWYQSCIMHHVPINELYITCIIKSSQQQTAWAFRTQDYWGDAQSRCLSIRRGETWNCIIVDSLELTSPLYYSC